VGSRILIADDQPLMRAALRDCLSAAPDFDVVGEASDGYQAVELARRLRPDVVVMDVRMPGLDGVAATRQLTAPGAHGGPVPRVLMLTTFDLDEYIVEALRAGASGFLLKDASAEELVRAIHVVAAGDALLAPAVTRRLLDRYARYLPSPCAPSQDPVRGLTERELAVFRLVSRGLSNDEIAARLHLARSSVKSHVSHLLGKLGRTDRVQLVVLAYESGLVRPGDPVAIDPESSRTSP
jgi:DNA-binding NarL/FixJ family response regulator